MRNKIILLAMFLFLFAAVTANPVFADTQGQPGDEGTHGDENTGQEGAGAAGQPGQKDGPGPEGNSGP